MTEEDAVFHDPIGDDDSCEAMTNDPGIGYVIMYSLGKQRRAESFIKALKEFMVVMDDQSEPWLKEAYDAALKMRNINRDYLDGWVKRGYLKVRE